MSRCAKYWLVVTSSFLLTYSLLSLGLNGRMGPHVWGDQHLAMRFASNKLAEYEMEYGVRPVDEEINELIQNLWSLEEPQLSKFIFAKNEKEISLALCFYSLRSGWPEGWIAPICVKNDATSDRVGLYWMGADRLSSTSGEDRDDINSWNRDSASYYYQQFKQREEFTKIGVSSGFTVFIFFLFRTICKIRDERRLQCR